MFQDYMMLLERHSSTSTIGTIGTLGTAGTGLAGGRAGLYRGGSLAMKKADFRTFYKDAHAVECLTEREKMLMGLAVAMMRLCDP
jgi:hypothetical protein